MTRGDRMKPSDIQIPESARVNLNIFLMDCMANGWSKDDRQEYFEACKQEFASPTEAGGMASAIEFWALMAARIKSRSGNQP